MSHAESSKARPVQFHKIRSDYSFPDAFYVIQSALLSLKQSHFTSGEHRHVSFNLQSVNFTYVMKKRFS
ncbi:hypothetical protein FJP62_12680 [Pantoea vagans]|nr:hypothetical protein FJP62_12680 [Pantoea vagans]